MQNPNKIIKFTFPLIVLLIIALSGCAGQPILVETYDSTVTIQGIDDPQHVEHFSLITVDNETIIEDDFSPNNVEEDTLTYELTGLDGETDIALVVNNDQIEGSLYSDNYQKTITPDNPDITLNLDQTQQEYSVEFTDPPNGVINAFVNETKKDSGDLVQAGSDVKFYVTPKGEENEFFKVKNWLVNNNEVPVQNTTYTYKNIQENINVGVELEKISYFKLYFNKDDLNVNVKDNEISADIQYAVENISDLEDSQNIKCYVDGEEWDSKTISLNPGEKIPDSFTWNAELEKPDTFEIKITTENETVIFYININNSAEISINYALPPSSPKNVSASVVDNGIQVTWDKVEEAVSYNLVRKEPYGRNYWTLIESGITGNTARISSIDTSVVPTVKYQYAVVAVDGNGLTSDYSKPTNEITFYEQETNQ